MRRIFRRKVDDIIGRRRNLNSEEPHSFRLTLIKSWSMRLTGLRALMGEEG